uniref:nuatigenin 3-beta-glucosyltransferase-like n=1 Tax=Erigeron canadensis TaxID=72917 RepID=UPI001CB8EA83|nr:nuatigenin 3-beta-glucosyltransferase-like [Erigeron canadensis]
MNSMSHKTKYNKLDDKMAYTGNNNNLHVVFLPLFAKSHMIPLVQVARLFAARGVRSTIITTIHNEQIFKNDVDRDIADGYPIAVNTNLTFPASEVGLPVGVENSNDGSVINVEYRAAVYRGMMMLQSDMERVIRDLAPDCIISDMFFPWTVDLAEELKIPRLLFYPNCLFFHSIVHSLKAYAPDADDVESFIVPNLPDEFTLKKSQVSDESRLSTSLGQTIETIHQSEKRSFGIIYHTFYEMEPAYVDHMRKVKGDKIWPIGPLFQFFRNEDCKTDGSSAERHDSLSWLDNQKQKSVIYVCFGSIGILPKAHVTEIALALEESKQPFLWVHRKHPGDEHINPFPDGFEERIKKENKGLVITSWAPQVEILQHPSILVFFSHCGWGSVLEAVVSGVPLVTYPLFADQLYIEKLVVEILKIGVGVGVEVWNSSSVKITSPVIGKGSIIEAFEKFTSGSSIAETITNNLKEITKKSKQAVEEGGSSFNNLTALIEKLKAVKFSQKT